MTLSLRLSKIRAALLLAHCLFASATIGAADQPLAVNDPANTTAPVVRFTAPLDNADVTLRTLVRGEVQSTALASWQLLAAPAGTAPEDLTRWTSLAAGTQNVLGDLAAFDPSLLPNGLWHLQLLATDLANRQSRSLITVEVLGSAKPGLFTISFLDLEVDAGGIPIRVTRTYDSRRKNEALDFGYGWSVDTQHLKLQKNMATGLYWTVAPDPKNPLALCLKPTGKRKVNITLPEGRVERFEAKALNECTQFQAPEPVIDFIPLAGATSQLAAINLPNLAVQGGMIYDMDALEPWNPKAFKLTTQEGIAYYLDENLGITRIKDPWGNTLDYSANGITHSNGQSVSFTRDGQGRITAITDPSGKTLRYRYTSAGDLTTVTDRLNQTTTLAYDAKHPHLLSTYTDPRGIQLLKNVYDDSGRLIAQYDAEGRRIDQATRDLDARQQTVVNRRGASTRYQYDQRGNVTQSRDAYGKVTSTTYDTQDNELTVTDPLGHTTRHTYDPVTQQRTSDTDPLGHATRYAYDNQHNLTQTTDALNRATQYTHDGRALTQLTDPLGQSTRFTYDAKGNLLSLTDPLGNKSSYQYDAQGRKTQETDAGGLTTTFTLDANGHIAQENRSVTTSSGLQTLITQRTLDANGRVLNETDPAGAVRQTTWTPFGEPATETDPLNRRTTHTYSERAERTGTTYPDGTKETFGYDAEGNKIASTDRAGRSTQYVYDLLNRLTQTVHPDGATEQNAYDAAGRLISSTDPRGGKTSYAYDAAGRKTSATDPLGQITRYAYNEVNDLTSVTAPDGASTSYAYDANHRRTQTTFADGSTEQVAYDAAGRRTQLTAADGAITKFGYDPLGRLTSVTDPLNKTTTYAYDELGRQTSQTDALGRITKFEYDAASRLAQKTLPNGSNESFTYDLAGNLVKHTLFDQRSIDTTVDVNDRPTKTSLPEGTSVSRTYTASGQVASVTDAHGTTTYQYDGRDRLTQVELPTGVILSYAYDAAGNRSEVTLKNGANGASHTTRYTFDADNRLASVTSPTGEVTSFAYDAAGRRSQVTRPFGISTAYAYDSAGRLKSLSHTKGATALATFEVKRDPAGRIVEQKETLAGQIKTRRFAYDPAGKLIDDDGSAFTYDAVGNRITSPQGAAAFDANDRITTQGSSTFTWDSNGRLTKETRSPETREFAWNSLDRLLEVKVTPQGQAAQITQYAYDADDHRIGITQGSGPNAQTTQLIVDANRTYAQVIAEREAASGSVHALYTFAEDLLQLSRAGQGIFYHRIPLTDPLGAVRLLIDESGGVSDSYSYDAWGNGTARTGTTSNPYKYQGEWQEDATGLVYLRARWYDPAVGRFVSVDPWSGNGARPISLHDYVFADDDPVNRRDPSGSMTATDATFGMSLSVIVSNALATVRFTAFVYGPMAAQYSSRAIRFMMSVRALLQALDEVEGPSIALSKHDREVIEGLLEDAEEHAQKLAQYSPDPGNQGGPENHWRKEIKAFLERAKRIAEKRLKGNTREFFLQRIQDISRRAGL